MKRYLVIAFVVASAVIVVVARGARLESFRGEQLVASAEAKGGDQAWRECLERLQAEVRMLRDLVPEQSYAMLGVAEQFSNLWYAVERGNWPLADFFLEETGESIEWAIKLKPIYRDGPGEEVSLAAIFESLETTVFPELKSSLAARDRARFAVAYRHMLQGCHACHKAVGKAYLRPRVPSEPATRIINFDPNATWPP